VVAAGSLPDIDAWDAWRPDQLASRLQALEVPWAVAAGWAIDLFLGGEPRAHDDLEIVVDRASFAAVRAALPDLIWFGAGGLEGEAGRVWPVDDAPAELHQTWGWDPKNECWRVDVFREPWDGPAWVCRRDPAIRRPVAEVIDRDLGGIPYLAPEIVLLFKANHAEREKDASDFARALPMLEPKRRRWLADALRIVHPGHHWISLVEVPAHWRHSPLPHRGRLST
jgi:Aminoglycoside-2''-adenylyltransferase